MEYIRYIDKTHEYYRNLGYEKTYNYAYNEEIPFTPLKKPLSESRVALVTTASFVLMEDAGNPLEEPRMLGTNELEVFTVPSDWPAYAPEHTPLHDFIFLKITVFPSIGNEYGSILPGQALVGSQYLSHGLRRSPTDPSGFIIQVPHEPPYDHPGRLHVFTGHT